MDQWPWRKGSDEDWRYLPRRKKKATISGKIPRIDTAWKMVRCHASIILAIFRIYMANLREDLFYMAYHPEHLP